MRYRKKPLPFTVPAFCDHLVLTAEISRTDGFVHEIHLCLSDHLVNLTSNCEIVSAGFYASFFLLLFGFCPSELGYSAMLLSVMVNSGTNSSKRFFKSQLDQLCFLGSEEMFGFLSV